MKKTIRKPLVAIMTLTAMMVTAAPSMKAAQHSVAVNTYSVADETPAVEINPATLGMSGATVGIPTKVATVHVKTVSLPANLDVYMTGKNASFFSASLQTIKKGTGEYDVDIIYTPTAIGKHTARLNFDCEAVPELTKAVIINGYAISTDTPPTISADLSQLKPFTAKVGEKQEQMIRITTAHLPDFATVKVEDAGAFLLGTTMLMKDGYADVKVTFAPKEAGEYKNKIIVSALGTDSYEIALTATATATGALAEEKKEGDELTYVMTEPLTLLNETFDGQERNKPLSISRWRNAATIGTRAWWGYSMPDYDEMPGENVAKVTCYDSKTTDDGEQTQMLLLTPALDFKNSKSKIFTFRVRGDYLRDNQDDLLKLVYVDHANGTPSYMFIDGMTMPAQADQTGDWQEYHLDFEGQQLPDVLFMGFLFESYRDANHVTTYYIDDVSFGRTDLANIHPSLTALKLETQPTVKKMSETVTVTTKNMKNPVTLKLGGANASKFKLSTKELPLDGGTFTVSFEADEEAVYKAYVKLSSRGAADVYIPITAVNSKLTGIEGIVSAEMTTVSVYDMQGRLVGKYASATVGEATEGLPAGSYIVKTHSSHGEKVTKVMKK